MRRYGIENDAATDQGRWAIQDPGDVSFATPGIGHLQRELHRDLRWRSPSPVGSSSQLGKW